MLMKCHGIVCGVNASEKMYDTRKEDGGKRYKRRINEIKYFMIFWIKPLIIHFCRCPTAREKVLIFECVFWSCGVGDTGGVSGLTRGLDTNTARSIFHIDDCVRHGHAL